MQNNTNLEKSFEETLDFITANLDFLKNNSNFIDKLEEDERKEYQLLEDKFKKFKKYKGIKRFSIPIIGMISSGKSSFLNFLLGFNCLEFGQDITSKCVVIIRHNRTLSKNEKYIYSVNINERSEGYYDFEKNEETKSDDVNKIIKEKNELIKNSEENKILKKEDFFLILEANIPLFGGKNEKFGNYFEFLDLPGLDEGKNDFIEHKDSKLFYEEILPKLAYNSLFSIFMFDAEKYMRDKNPEIYKDYLKKFFLNNYTNSFFILNKIDLMKDEEKEKKDFENYMLKNQLNINLKDTSIHIEYLSCKNLTRETKQFDSFQNYLKYLLTEGGNNKTSLFLFLQDKMVQDFKLDLNKVENKEPNEEQEKDITQKIQELSDENSSFSELIEIDDYFNYSNAFDELNKLFKKSQEENYLKKSEKYKDLYDNFNKSFDNSINNFLSIPYDKEIIGEIERFEKNITKIKEQDKESINKNQKFLDSLYNNISNNSSNIKLIIKKFQKLKPTIEALYKEGNDLEIFQDLKKDFEIIDFFIKKDKKIRIPLFEILLYNLSINF